VHAGQIPVVDGVTGGVPSGVKLAAVTKVANPVPQATTTPGKLRVTENSGVCGMS
jgi:hypothetical protein